MTFTVKHQAGRYDIIDERKMIHDSFDDEADAIAEAKRMNEEYERVLSFL